MSLYFIDRFSNFVIFLVFLVVFIIKLKMKSTMASSCNKISVSYYAYYLHNILFQFMFILFQAMNMILMILLSVLVNNNDSCEGLTVSLQKDINLKLFFIFLSLF